MWELEQGELVKTEVVRVKCLRENAVLPKRGSEGAAGYDLSASCNCVIPCRGRGLDLLSVSRLEFMPGLHLDPGLH